MSNRLLVIAFLGSLALGAVAVADTKAAADPKAGKAAPKAEPKAPAGDALDTKKMASTPPAELASLSKFFVGSWHCEGKTTPAPGVGKTFNSKGNTTWASTLDGFWLTATSEGEKVPGMPLPTVAKGETHITYDRVTKAFVSTGFNNRGGYGTATSTGWDGDKLAWTGTMSGLIKTDTRTTITKKGETEYHFLGERMEGGKWVTGGDEICKKK